MNQLKIYIYILLSAILVSCGGNSETESEELTTPRTPVEVVTLSTGSINDELTFFGTTAYLRRNLVTASIPAFISQVNVKLGDRVNKGDLLYVLQSKERRALGDDVSKIDSALRGFGVIKITASASGVITTLDKQQSGDYVLEGTQLCTIAESNDLVFQVNVPFEYTALTKTGNTCTLILPDNTKHIAVFTKALTAMNVASQTQTILAKCNENLFLPENMIVKVGISKGTHSDKQILPKSCVSSDEMMKEFWIMKMVNDSMAIKQIVNIGNKNSEWIEILSPKFKATEKIISTGNFGLPDTALVQITTIQTK